MTHPSQVHKYCSRCGSDSLLFQEDNAFVCSACDFRYHINSVAAVALLILNEKGELLLTKRAFDPEKGKFDLPGGFVDVGEKAEDAVKRELQEELNLNVCKMEYFGSYPNEYVYSGLTIYTLDMAFVCTVESFSSMEANDDVADYRFYALDCINLEEIAFKSVEDIIADFLQK